MRDRQLVLSRAWTSCTHACMNEREEWSQKKWNLPCLLLCCGRAEYVFCGLCFVIDLPVAVRSRMDDAEFVMAEHEDSNR